MSFISSLGQPCPRFGRPRHKAYHKFLKSLDAAAAAAPKTKESRYLRGDLIVSLKGAAASKIGPDTCKSILNFVEMESRGREGAFLPTSVSGLPTIYGLYFVSPSLPPKWQCDPRGAEKSEPVFSPLSVPPLLLQIGIINQVGSYERAVVLRRE